jgi:hypothetical protein
MLKGHREMVIPGKVLELHGNKEFIRELKRFDNHQDFFANFSAGPGTHLNVNQVLHIDAKAFFQMMTEQRDLILEHSRDLKDGRIKKKKYEENVKAITKEYRIKFEHQKQEARKKIEEAFQVGDVSEIVVAGERIFKNLQPHKLVRLHQVCKEAGKDYNPDLIEVARVMADKLKCKNVADFTAVMEYSIRKLDAIVRKLLRDNSNPEEKPADVRSKNYYCKIVANEFLSEQGQQNAMAEEFNKLREESMQPTAVDLQGLEIPLLPPTTTTNILLFLSLTLSTPCHLKGILKLPER